MRLIIKILVILLFGMTTTQAQVYRCIDSQGHTVYQSTQCPDYSTSTEIPIMEKPSGPSGGLRESERALLNEIRERELEQIRRQPQRQTASPSAVKRCNGFNIVSVLPFERLIGSGSVADTSVSVDIDKIQCATVQLTVTGLDGRLRDSAQDLIKERVSGVLANNTERPARSVRLRSDTPRRLSSRDELSANVCFGASDHAVMEVKCR